MMNLSLVAVLMLPLCFPSNFCSCMDTISSTQTINDSENIVSDGGTFKFGFFSPANSTNRYVGILCNISVMTPIWVANRDKPLNDSLGTVTISEDGNIIILDGRKQIIWSSNVSNSMANSSAKLLNTGNLVLQGNSSEITLWESFQHLSDSFVRSMRLSTNINTDQKKLLTSWMSPSDPSIGSFSLGLDPSNIPELFVWNGSKPLWRSGPWNGQVFIGVADMSSTYRTGFILEDNRQGSVSLTYTYTSDSVLLYYFLSSEGTVTERYLLEGKEDWEVSWSSLLDECDVYGKCGPFGICNSEESPICSCLNGFEPVHMEEWSKGNWTRGCSRRTQLKCGRNNITGEEVKEDGFLKFSEVKVPDFADSLAPTDDCERLCFNNCSCIAYAYNPGIGCMVWNGSLIDIRKFSGGSGGADLYLRVANSELGKKRNMGLVIAITVITGSITVFICSYVVWNCITQKRGRMQKNELLISGGLYSHEVTLGNTINRVKKEELHIFNFEKIASATGNFQLANKLGQGGFGPVYKGTLPYGQEIAVKRLSISSGQGQEEFMNEVVLISKLQHRNLVRLLGCCIEREEKMLIYEYMPNKSLDAHLFDPVGQEHLDWNKRAKIIEGIGRGLLYLHRDSRLRIIHRDLKASNILLDQELNPKISDFGMARIFKGDQDQAKTTRVVGTYGYMAPEYAMEGRFSEKSDVYSFGVLLLEVVSGRRNSSFYDDEYTLSLLQLAWKLWNEGKIVKLIDVRLSDPISKAEVVRYIHVGLLCVQEFVKDRPIVSTVLSMLSSEISDLPNPNQPAFTGRQSSSDGEQRGSVNNVSITFIEGR